MLNRFCWALTPLVAMCATPMADAGDEPALKPGLYARIETTRGAIVCRLEFKKTPLTVMNFVGLAEGAVDVNPGRDLAEARQALPHIKARNAQQLASGNAGDKADAQALAKIYDSFEDRVAKLPKTGTPFYDGIVFHRVIPGFMAQVGDPYGLGIGGPGYRFVDECRSDLLHDRPGILSMANSGPGTNGSQFFITHEPTPHLDGKHTVFGSVVQGQNVVKALRIGDEIRSVRILRVGPEAEAFVVTPKSFAQARTGGTRKAIIESIEANIAQLKKSSKPPADRLKTMEELKNNAAKSEVWESGILSRILKEGKGEPIGKGKTASAHYTGYRLDGLKFDSSVDRNETFDVQVGAGMVIPGWDLVLEQMRVGEKRAVFLPPELAYGRRGAGRDIPPNTILYFEMELVAAK